MLEFALTYSQLIVTYVVNEARVYSLRQAPQWGGEAWRQGGNLDIGVF